MKTFFNFPSHLFSDICSIFCSWQMWQTFLICSMTVLSVAIFSMSVAKFSCVYYISVSKLFNFWLYSVSGRFLLLIAAGTTPIFPLGEVVLAIFKRRSLLLAARSFKVSSMLSLFLVFAFTPTISGNLGIVLYFLRWPPPGKSFWPASTPALSNIAYRLISFLKSSSVTSFTKIGASGFAPYLVILAIFAFRTRSFLIFSSALAYSIALSLP